jgi:hypothetical protein
MDWDYISGVIRHVLAVVAGGFVTQGYMSADTANMIVGGIVAALSVAWSMWQKQQAAAKLTASKAETEVAKSQISTAFTAGIPAQGASK